MSSMVENSDIITVELADETQATTLFEKKLRAQADEKDAIQLIIQQK